MKKLLFIILSAILLSLILSTGLWAEEASQGVPEGDSPSDLDFTAQGMNFLDFLFFRVNTVAANEVDKQLALFSETIRERFALYLKRSGKYMGLMKGILSEKGLPEDLAFLPLIESGFSTQARSPKKAVGPWQFIPSTGKLYGLKINAWVDERKDPIKSTEAAAAYLTDLYSRFGSWSLAMAAYNAGEGKIGRALAKAKADDFWDIHSTRHIRAETKNYVPKFIAARLIAQKPEDYGFEDISYEEPFIYDEVTVDGPVTLDVIAKCVGATGDEIAELNPELIRWCTPPDVKEYTLRIPAGTREKFIEGFSKIPESERYTKCTIPYIIKKGDTISRISKKTGVPQAVIFELNRIKKTSRLRIGQEIALPFKKGRS